jgi:hypothetical protein
MSLREECLMETLRPRSVSNATPPAGLPPLAGLVAGTCSTEYLLASSPSYQEGQVDHVSHRKMIGKLRKRDRLLVKLRTP